MYASVFFDIGVVNNIYRCVNCHNTYTKGRFRLTGPPELNIFEMLPKFYPGFSNKK